MEINEELHKVLNLLQQEKEADLLQYKEKMAGTSIAERRKEGICWYPVNIYPSHYQAGERILIKLARPKEHKEAHLFQSGKLVMIFSNAGKNSEKNHTIQGVVNQAKESEMIITLNAHREPNWLNDGYIGIQLLFDENAYMEMARAIKFVINDGTEKLCHLKHILLGNKKPAFDTINEIKLPQLNNSQNRALNQTRAAKDIAIIHGPPGTGKTTTLIESIHQILKTEKQVMVTAPSNAAVDLVAEKLGEKDIEVVRIGHPARVTEELLSKTIDAGIANHPSYKDLKTLKKQADEHYRLARKYKRNFGQQERQQRKLLLQEVSQLRKEADQLEHYIINSILSQAQVVACTMVGAANHLVRDRQFTTVFIDEAAQGLEPATWIPITRADRVIFAGDHCQLPPTVKCLEAARSGLSETLFEKAIRRNNMATMLQEQYRMHTHIMNFSNNYFYNNNLIANNSVAQWQVFPGDRNVEFVDTAGCGFDDHTERETRSSLNPEEADLLQKHLKQYLNTLQSVLTEDQAPTIGIISPYKAQVKLLQNNLNGLESEHPHMDTKITINTIDAFQGQERDIIYISLVRSNEKGEIGFLSDTRRMNVAMTRARKKLVIIGDSATIGQHEFYNQLLDYVNEIDAYRSAFEWLY